MSDVGQTLMDLLRLAQTRHGEASGRRLGEIAAREGHVISHVTINKILSGTYYSTPSAGTLDGIAYLAGVDREVAYEAAKIKMLGPPFSDGLPPDVDRLSPKQREAVMYVIRAMLYPEAHSAGETGHEMQPNGRNPLPSGGRTVSPEQDQEPQGDAPDESEGMAVAAYRRGNLNQEERRQIIDVAKHGRRRRHEAEDDDDDSSAQ